jgi:hypothetical protein
MGVVGRQKKSKKSKNFLYEAAESCTIDGESPVVKRK